MAKPRGAKPKPTHLKVVTGNPGRRPLPKDEPKVPLSVPPAPKHLSETEAEVYADVAGDLFRHGIMTKLDRGAVARYAVVWCRWVEAENEVKASGYVIETKSGNLIQNPSLGIANRAQAQLAQLEAEFGMTPSSRTRIKAIEPQKTDPFDQFLERGT